ncbi:MAG: HD domain-containing protein, partial [Planctomycetes bacterium]|nr:HD domain-containing protein [Planctomycetota bacterium]
MPLSMLPELISFDSHAEGVRIPPGVTVPLTARVRALLDTAAMRRLARVSQLGLVALVYPGAVHSRFEHSLGVYRLALEFLARLRHDPRFAATVCEADAAAFLVAALVHDIGHWPFCHPIEDVGLPQFPKHESLVHEVLAQGEPANVLRQAWNLDPARVASLITGTASDPAGRVLHSLLSGPIDVDKMDYLGRDSLHAGVPYGRHFDQERLLSSLCLDQGGTALAITSKGRTAAELLVFARYVM